ncbi:hypothetical protein, partial [Sideroxydans sp. CL21]
VIRRRYRRSRFHCWFSYLQRMDGETTFFQQKQL